MAWTALTGNERVAPFRWDVPKVRESAAAELLPQPLRRNVDRRPGTAREREQDVTAPPGDTRDLVEERDHVRVRDEVEGAVCKRQRRRVRLLIRHVQVGGCVATGLLEHRLRQVDTDDRRLGEARRQSDRASPRARADVEDARRRSRESVEPGVIRCERVLEPHGVPNRRERVELPAYDRTEELPEDRAAHGRVGGKPRKPTPDRGAGDHEGSRGMRTGGPGLTPSIAAALPPLIASDRLRYESSYRIRSPRRASANARAATA